MISVSIVVFHTPKSEVISLLNCILESSVESIYVIDNSSNDFLRTVSSLSSKINYIHSLNIGYGAGHNIAIRAVLEGAFKYHIVINPDVCFDKSVIEELSNYMNLHVDCGLVMPKVLYPNGNLQYLCKLLPTPFDLLVRRFIPINRYIDKKNEKYELRFCHYDRIMEVPSLSGCFMFLRVDCLGKIGGFDERYFMYAEDVDLCRRIGSISKTIFYPHVSICHCYAKESYVNFKLLKYHVVSLIKKLF